MTSTTSRVVFLLLFTLTSFLLPAQSTYTLKAKDFEKASLNEDAILVDVRTPLEWRAGIITGAKLQNVLEADSFTTAIQQWDRTKTYLLYCNSGKKSQLALEKMQSVGFTNVFDLSGGFTAWKKYESKSARKIQLPSHRLVIQVSTGDTLAWKGLINNFKNLQAEWSYTAQIVVVVHGPAIDLLRKDKTTQQEGITHYTKLGIEFLACENTLRERNVSKEQIVKEAGFTKAGIPEIIRRQEAGWSYIKAGF